MTAADLQMIDEVRQREGGFVNNPLDRGGPTNQGITLTTLCSYRGRKVTVDELKALTDDEVRDIYFVVYIVRPGIIKIDEIKMRECLFDSAVNEGPTRSIKHFQHALGVKEDGVLGPVTIARYNVLIPFNVLLKVFGSRLRHYAAIMSADHTQREFASGWMNRLADLMEDLAT